MKKALIAVVVALVISAVILFLPLFLPPTGGSTGDRAIEGLPWQVEALADGNSRVFGLTLGATTLGQARTLLKGEMQLAIVAAPGETGSLEAYYEDFTAGAVSGKLILTARLPTATIEAMRSRGEKAEYMQSSTKKTALHADDLPVADAAVIAAAAFIPAVNLDEGMVTSRFGAPAERIRSSEQTEHFLYPAKGLDLRLDKEAKEVLQYVPPREFARLREPLLAAPAKAAP